MRVTARGRDLHTGTGGGTSVLSSGRVDLEVDFSDGVIAHLTAEPRDLDLSALVGGTAYRGFRAAPRMPRRASAAPDRSAGSCSTTFR